MDNYCGDCELLGRKDSDTYKNWMTGKITYKCHKSGKYKEYNDKACNDFKGYKKTGNYKPSECYITTIVCEILGYEDHCELLNTLRDFRDNYLKKDLNNYLPILQEYDFIGPIISDCIRNMDDNKIFSLLIMSSYLIPCVNEIKNENYENAIRIYKEMVLLLVSNFEINLTIGENIPYNFEDLGKGRIRTIN